MLRRYFFSAITLLILGWGSFFQAGCGSQAAISDMASSSKGATLNVKIESDTSAVSPSISTLKNVTINSGANCPSGAGSCFTPQRLILGLRNLALVACQNAGGSIIHCPGSIGDSIDSQLIPNEQSVITLELFSTPLTLLIHENDNVSNVSPLGTTGTITSPAITANRLYSGIQLGLDFIIAQYPSDNAPFAPNAGEEGSGEDQQFLFWCLNANGCSALDEYASDLPGLKGADVQQGDMLLTDTRLSKWYFWDSIQGKFILTEKGRPSTTISTDTPTWPVGSSGELLYRANLGNELSVNITSGDVTTAASDILTINLTVINSLNFTSTDNDDVLDVKENGTLKFQFPTLSKASTASGVFQ